MKALKMKLANAFALATGILWVLCAAFVWAFPDFTWSAVFGMMHGMDFSVMGGWNLTFNNVVFGGISWVVCAWITGWVLGWSWEAVGGTKKK